MKRKTGRVRSALAIILALLMFASAAGLGEISALAETKTGEDKFNEIMTYDAPPAYTDGDYEPYGFGKDVPFVMNQMSELLIWATNTDSSGDIKTVYDRLKSGNTQDLLNSGTATAAIKAPVEGLKKASYVKAVAFDPTGSGRKDHIAFIGVNSNKSGYVWVYDTRQQKWDTNGGLELCRTKWMKGDSLTDYEAANFLSITAGDYDGDGKDTIVAYVAADGYDAGSLSATDIGYRAYQIRCSRNSSNRSTLAIMETGTAFAHRYYKPEYSERDLKAQKMGCALGTGDFNGDGIDELAAVTYIGNYDNSNQVAATYAPQLAIMKCDASTGKVLQSYAKRFFLWDEPDNNKSGPSIISPGLGVGDVNGDGVDEIVCAGVKNVITKNGAGNAGSAHDVKKDKIGVFICSRSGVSMHKEVAANAWTQSGFYPNDKVWSPITVQCAAMNGAGNAEKIFISGTIYEVRGSELSAAYTPSYFENGSDGLDFKTSSNMFVQSAAAGNFDANKYGYEQIVYTASCKTSGSLCYDYLMGVIGGKNHDAATGIAQGYYSTASGSLDDDNSYPHRVDGSNVSGDITQDHGLNCIAVAIDNDNDGMLARYKGKTFTYSDPSVLCVLQAAPYFKELKEYAADTSGTTYTISNSYSFDKTKTSSLSFGIGAACEIGTPAMNLELNAGYAMDWETSFTEGLTEQQQFSFSANDDDTVVVYRTPVTCYIYQVQDPSGVWEKDGKDNTFVITVPSQPLYETMPIDEYNAFARYYNTWIKKRNAGARELEQLNNKYIGHEGEPDKYITRSDDHFPLGNYPAEKDGYTVLQDSPLKLGYNSSSTGWSLYQESSTTTSESMSHGVTFDAKMTFGPDLGVTEFSVGVSTSLQYMSGETLSTTKTQGKGISCSVFNINSNDAPASLKVREYKFSYQMARWPSGITRLVGGKTERVPVYGYALSGVSKPYAEPDVPEADQKAAAAVTKLIEALPAASAIQLTDMEQVLEARKAFEALSINAKSLVDTTKLEAAEEKLERLIEASGDAARILVQPKGQTVTVGDKARLSVMAIGRDLSYQWYYRSVGASGWTAISADSGKTDSYSLTTAVKHDGYQYYCKVTAADGSTAQSETVMLKVKPKITAQPKAQTVTVGEKASFTVKATGGKSYQWYYRTGSTGTWKAITAASAKTASYSLTTAAKHDGYQYRCRVKNNTSTVYTKAVTLTVKPKITAQPAGKEVTAGAKATFTVKASGAQKYQWYYRIGSTGSWTKVSKNGTSASYTVTAAARHDGYQYRCLVTNKAGKVYTKAAVLTVDPKITAQPASKSVRARTTVSFTVKAVGAKTYQWYYRTGSTGAWKKVASNGTAATYKVTAAKKLNGYQYRCVVTNKIGKATSRAAALTVK